MLGEFSVILLGQMQTVQVPRCIRSIIKARVHMVTIHRLEFMNEWGSCHSASLVALGQ